MEEREEEKSKHIQKPWKIGQLESLRGIQRVSSGLCTRVHWWQTKAALFALAVRLSDAPVTIITHCVIHFKGVLSVGYAGGAERAKRAVNSRTREKSWVEEGGIYYMSARGRLLNECWMPDSVIRRRRYERRRRRFWVLALFWFGIVRVFFLYNML